MEIISPLMQAPMQVASHLVQNAAGFDIAEFIITYLQRNVFICILGFASWIGIIVYWEYFDGLMDFEWRKSTEKGFGLKAAHRFGRGQNGQPKN